MSAARQAALDQSSAKYVAFLDVDDVWYPSKLAEQLSVLEDSGYVLCTAGIKEVTPEDTVIREVMPSFEAGHQFGQQLSNFDINMVTPVIPEVQ